MHHFAYRDGRLHCEDVPLDVIAEAVGTPAYVYSAATLERHLDVFQEAFAPRKVLVAFAVKANANVAVLATLARKGAGADTVSAGEIVRALRAGVSPRMIIFSGVGKTREELAFALASGVGQINVESAAELELLHEVAAQAGTGAPIAIRVNPDIGAGDHGKITTGGADAKFGVDPTTALQLYARAAALPHLQPLGLAVHIGSQIKALAPLQAAFARLRDMAIALRAQGLPVRRLDLGGGLGVPYHNEPPPPGPDAYAAMIAETLGELDVELAFEPGRLIAGNAGVLLTRVIRRQPRPDRDIIVLDAGMNDLIRPAMYDAYHDLQPVSQPAREAHNEQVDLVGPVCETGDTFARNRLVPPLHANDLVAFLTAGAYAASMASTYNARPLAPEVLVRGGSFAIVRERIGVEEMLRAERLPPWLETG